MPIKLIAVDMDGTFLNNQQDYDRERFRKQYLRMKEEGIRFVVASGNQYFQLKSFFGEFQDEITYVAENGAFVVDQGEELFSANIPGEVVKAVTEEILQHTQISVVLCGKESAYVLESLPEESFGIINRYYHRLKRVTTFDVVDDQILKFALACPFEETEGLLELLQSKIGMYMTPVSSGHGDIDLILPGCHKAAGIELLQEKWGLNPGEMMAFGDGGNDIEMLRHVSYSFAMENGSEAVKEIAKYIAPPNTNNGVLEVIDQYFDKQGPFANEKQVMMDAF
ncbi:Cof-type HAD-IIB family hydrolase [Neobacillus niacini]|uniref:Cof-type HAD-IIB family hydrolase n=1 Tax=Neobacillus niacini TaxID=86668 RepID=UPI0021CB0871|nr:Cof-type HAD-IIB family hydrolase [Neobacillus niacini]MCM3764506.1 Cof-type HAD-IIB family hydrolase [Neobacillus niacini]